jgi:hypothetical protein
MQLSDFHTGRPSVKFTEITTREFPTVEGEIVEEPELVPDKFGGPNDKCLVLVIKGNDTVERTLFLRKQQLGTVGDAVAEAGTSEIERGWRPKSLPRAVRSRRRCTARTTPSQARSGAPSWSSPSRQRNPPATGSANRQLSPRHP